MATERLEKLKRRLPKEENEELLKDFLEEAELAIRQRRGITLDDEFPEQYSVLAVTIAEYLYARQGSIGEIIHIEGGVNRHYGDGYIPESLLKNVIPLVKVIK